MSGLAPHKIRVENYYGPLDLLLHLVKEAEVDITRVALAQVASQYIAFIEAMKKLDIELAGEFLSVASQLLLIKSRTVLPDGVLEEEEEEEDASLELIRHLLQYKIFKDRARALVHMEAEHSRRFGRPRMKTAGEPEEERLADMELWDLVVLWGRLSKAIRLDASIDILYETVPIEVFIDRILASLGGGKTASFRRIVGDPEDRGKLVGTFLAMLELMKEQRVDAEQTEDGGDITITLQDN
ncbi:MAG: segregation and condensation protein A [Planctomycetota bacterium]|jgi:segregation and condensation protein A